MRVVVRFIMVRVRVRVGVRVRVRGSVSVRLNEDRCMSGRYIDA